MDRVPQSDPSLERSHRTDRRTAPIAIIQPAGPLDELTRARAMIFRVRLDVAFEVEAEQAPGLGCIRRQAGDELGEHRWNHFLTPERERCSDLRQRMRLRDRERGRHEVADARGRLGDSERPRQRLAVAKFCDQSIDGRGIRTAREHRSSVQIEVRSERSVRQSVALFIEHDFVDQAR